MIVFKPKTGVRVPYIAADGSRQIVPADGMRVDEPLSFWLRRAADGDGELIVRNADPEPAPAPPPAPDPEPDDEVEPDEDPFDE